MYFSVVYILRWYLRVFLR